MKESVSDLVERKRIACKKKPTEIGSHHSVAHYYWSKKQQNREVHQWTRMISIRHKQ